MSRTAPAVARPLRRATAALVAVVGAAVLAMTLLTGTDVLARLGLATQAARLGVLVVCPRVEPVEVDGIEVPAGPVGGYCQDRLVEAAQIVAAARSLGIGPHTQAIGVMTAMGESGLVDLDHGDAAGPDSRGLFQQRANGAWGSTADRMSPYRSAYDFFAALVAIPGWQRLTPVQAAHVVQGNADPGHYGRYWRDAVAVVDALDPH